jgi:hypothetical protein
LSAFRPDELSCRLHRKFERFQFEVNTEVAWQSRKSWARVTDISRTGLFIEMAETPAPGAYFSVSLALNLPLKLDCIVRRVVPRHGIGVALSVPEQSKKRFEALLLALSAGDDSASTAATAPRPEPPRTFAKAASSATA